MNMPAGNRYRVWPLGHRVSFTESQDSPSLGGGEPSVTLTLHTHEPLAANSPSSNRSSPALLAAKRRTISLFFGFLIPAVIASAVFFSVSWVMVHHSARESVEMVSDRLHELTALHLRHVIDTFLEKLVVTTQMAHAKIGWDATPAEVEKYFIQAIIYGNQTQFFGYIRTDGYVLSTAWYQNTVTMGERPADCNNSSLCSNGSLFNVNQALAQRITPAYKTYPFDARNYPFYKQAVRTGAATFTSPYANSETTSDQALVYSVPVTYPNGSLQAVISISYQFNALVALLKQAQNTLRTSGALLLLNSGGELLASSAPASTVDPTDRSRLVALPRRARPRTDSIWLNTFGDCYVLHLSICEGGESPSASFRLTGIDWRLFVLIPKSDYFEVLARQNRIEIGFITGCIVFFIIVVGLFFRILLTVPIRHLLKQLQALKILLRLNRKSDEMVDHEPILSRFSEIAALHLGVLEVVKAAEESVEQRAKEMVKASEAEMAFEETQKLMRAKEMFRHALRVSDEKFVCMVYVRCVGHLGPKFARHLRETSDRHIYTLMARLYMFFAMMSHELRTPLTACIGMAEVLLGTLLNPMQKECTDAIFTGGEMMLTLINNILDFSKLEAERFVIENIPFSVREVCERVCQTIQINAEEKRLELIANIASDIPSGLCMGDPSRLGQVLLNLLSNAVKFTKVGTVTLSCVSADPYSVIPNGGLVLNAAEAANRTISASNIAAVRFEVRDTGIGLSPQTLEQLFQPFVQGDSTMSRRYGGTGLGLVISQRIVSVMGGQLKAHSEGPEKGCVFSFTLPFELQNAHVAPSVSSPKASPPTWSPDLVSVLPSIHVAVVDANSARQHAILELLRATQLTNLFAFTEISKIKDSFFVPRKGADGGPIAKVILMHIQDVGEDIEIFVEKTRQFSPPSSAEWKFVFLCNMKNTLSGANALSGVAFLPKPGALRKLQQTVEELVRPVLLKPTVGPHSLVSTPISPKNGPGFSPRRMSMEDRNISVSSSFLISSSTTPKSDVHILIADDVVLNQRVMTLKLQQKGFTNIKLASSGLAALNAVREAPRPFDLILMDVMMPALPMHVAWRS